MLDGPITDVNSLALVSDPVAAQIKAAAGINLTRTAQLRTAASSSAVMTKPGVERWPVKTGQDARRNTVGKDVIAGHDLGAGIVATTIDELITAARPADMADPRQQYPAYQRNGQYPSKRRYGRSKSRSSR